MTGCMYAGIATCSQAGERLVEGLLESVFHTEAPGKRGKEGGIGFLPPPLIKFSP